MSFIDPRPMIVDSFAGGGGASTGIENALGRSPDVAINHSTAALALHAANHPDTLHLDSNIWDVDPLAVTKGRHLGLLWASPDCKHFSKAKGGSLRDRNIRDLAWVVVKWAEFAKPDVICMENVEEFVTWGPLGEDGKVIKELSGVTFELWVKRLKKAGYKVHWRELRACDYGAPTIRKRWFLIARRDGRPIIWPKPTHGRPDSKEVRQGKLLPWIGADTCIDWSLPCPSIFDSADAIKEKHGLRAIRPLANNTMARVARGMKRYVLDADRPFIVNLTHGGRCEDASEPFRTITGAHRGEKAVVMPIMTHLYTSNTAGGQGSVEHPLKTITAGGLHAAVITPSIQRFNSGATGQDIRDPLATVTANSWIKKPGGAAPLGVLTPYLASIAHGDSGGRREYPLSEPLGTVTVGGIQHAAIAPFLATMRNSQKPWQGADEPTHTITAGGAGLTLVSPVLTYAQQGGGNRSIEDPHHTICASRKDQNSMFSAFLAQQNGGPRMGTNAGHDPREPLSTATSTGSQQTPVAAFIARQFGASTGHEIDVPLGTVTAGGQGKSQLVAPWFAKYYGTGDGARTNEPCHTVTVKDRFSHCEAELAAPPFGPDHHARAREVAEFLRAHDAWDGGEFVTLTIAGVEYVIVDIGMRMLTPRELFRAQGFPDDYVIEGVWEGLDTDEPTWRTFPKDVQVSCCGNSVCPPLAEAIVAANCQHLVAAERREGLA